MGTDGDKQSLRLRGLTHGRPWLFANAPVNERDAPPGEVTLRPSQNYLLSTCITQPGKISLAEYP